MGDGMEQGVQRAQYNRRSGPDWLQKSMLFLGIFCWLLFLLALLLFHYARPEVDFGYLRYLHLDVRSHWREELKELLVYVLSACSALSLATIVLNHFRSRRKTDQRWYNIIVLLLISFVAVILSTHEL